MNPICKKKQNKKSIPVPNPSSGLSSDTLISRKTSTLTNLNTSVPWLVNQTEKVVFILIHLLVSGESVVQWNCLPCSRSLELGCLLHRCLQRLGLVDWLDVWCSLDIYWLDIGCAVLVDNRLWLARSDIPCGAIVASVVVDLGDSLSIFIVRGWHYTLLNLNYKDRY